LLIDAGGHPRRREELNSRASDAKAIRLMDDLFVLADVKLWATIVFFGHPMVMDIDDEALHDSPL